MIKNIKQFKLGSYIEYRGFINTKFETSNYSISIIGYQIYSDIDGFFISNFQFSLGEYNWTGISYNEIYDYDKNDLNIFFKYGL